MTNEQTSAAREVSIIAALMVATCWLASSGQNELAATALGGVLGMLTPRRVPPIAPALALCALVGAV